MTAPAAGGPEPTDAEMAELADEARLAEAAAARRSHRDLEELGEDLATFVGTLVDLAESASPVTLIGLSGRSTSGTIEAVAEDHVAIRTAVGQRCLHVTAAISSVRATRETARPARGDRRASEPVDLAERLGGLLDGAPEVLVVSQGVGAPTRGRLHAASGDVLTLTPDGGGAVLVHLPTVESVTLL